MGGFMDRSRLRGFVLVLTLFVALCLPGQVYGADDGAFDKVPVTIIKVEGTGTPLVKRRHGTELVAGVGGQLFAGDRVITDNRSVVHLMVNDGSILKVGFQSEFRIEGAEPRATFLSWTFHLMHGVVRALVEKIPEKDTHMRVNTPSGTVGVRGTEFVVAYDKQSSTAYLYTIEGLVFFGELVCDGKNTCVDVAGGETSMIRLGEKTPSSPKKYNAKELFGVAGGKEGKKDQASAETMARLSLFTDAKRLGEGSVPELTEEELAKVEKDGVEELAEDQDRALGRTKEERDAMHADAKRGRLRDTLRAADAYAKAKGVKGGGGGDFFGPKISSKHKLGSAVTKAAESNAFVGGKGKSGSSKAWEENKFTFRKTVNYQNAEALKQQKADIEKAVDDYDKMVSYVEGLQEARDATKNAKAQAEAVASAKADMVCVTNECREEILRAEMSNAMEAVAKAYGGTTSLNVIVNGAITTSTTSKASSETVSQSASGGAGIGAAGGVPKVCYTTKRECKQVLCTGGVGCQKGTSTEVCEDKRIEIACSSI